MSTDLIEFFRIKLLFIEFLNSNKNNYKYLSYSHEEINNSSIESEIISQLLIIVACIIKKRRYNNDNDNQSQIEKQIIFESQILLKKIQPSAISDITNLIISPSS